MQMNVVVFVCALKVVNTANGYVYNHIVRKVREPKGGGGGGYGW